MSARINREASLSSTLLLSERFLTSKSIVQPNLARSIYSKCDNSQYSSELPLTNFNQITSLPIQVNYFIQKRYKKRLRDGKKGNKEEDDEEEEDDDEDDLANENPLLVEETSDAATDGSSVAVIDVGSLRLDAFCKMAFGMSRAKVEEAIYKGDVYVNGERPPKKSYDVQMDDEIDIVKHKDTEDHTKIVVRRVVALKYPDKATETGRMKVKVRRWTDLTIDAYDVNKNED